PGSGLPPTHHPRNARSNSLVGHSIDAMNGRRECISQEDLKNAPPPAVTLISPIIGANTVNTPRARGGRQGGGNRGGSGPSPGGARGGISGGGPKIPIFDPPRGGGYRVLCGGPPGEGGGTTPSGGSFSPPKNPATARDEDGEKTHQII